MVSAAAVHPAALTRILPFGDGAHIVVPSTMRQFPSFGFDSPEMARQLRLIEERVARATEAKARP